MNQVKAEEQSTHVALVASGDTICLLGLKGSCLASLMLVGSHREQQPIYSQQSDEATARARMAEMLLSSERNGWTIFYQGPPLLG